MSYLYYCKAMLERKTIESNENYLYYYKARVVTVYDGDTLRADVDLGFGFLAGYRMMPFRLYGINAPEMGKPGALDARDRLDELVCDKDVLIHSCGDDKGKYGRWLAQIWIPDDTRTVNDILVEEGHAVYRTY